MGDRGRNLREVNFDTDSNGLRLGRFQAIDYFGDGSFYLLDAPGVGNPLVFAAFANKVTSIPMVISVL